MLEPSWAERARTILAANHEASLATVDVDGRPVVGTEPMIADASGSPVTVLSNLSTHTSRGRQDQRAAMSIGDRLLIQGDLRPVPGLQQIELTEPLLQHHPHLRAQVESLDWSWFRLEATRVRWTDDRGTERWLRPEDLAGAEADPLVLHGPEFLDLVREKLDDQLMLIAKTLGGRWLASSAELVAIDRYGICVDVVEPSGARRSRVPFPDRLRGPEDVHAAIGSLVRSARSVPRDESERSAASLLEPVERNRSGGTDVDRVDSPGHRYPNALINGLQHAAAQTRALGPQEDGDSFLLTEAELFEADGIRPWRESEEPVAGSSEDVEAIGQGLEPGVGEGVGLAHGDSAGSTVERVATRGITEEGIDPESGGASEDHTHVGRVVDSLEDDDAPGLVSGEDLGR